MFTILNSLIISGIFCFALYAFAVTPMYNPGDTLDPACSLTDPNCTVTSPAYFSFGSNNFSGTGNFTTTGTVQGGIIIAPTLLGGTATTSDLTLQTTSGVGDTGADMHFLVGNNGATEAMTILNSGNVGIGITNPQVSLFNNGDFITKGPFADVRAFGAKGDGVSDDTSAVQAALNASLNVYFPAGTYIVSNLTPRNNQRIFGDGTSSSLQFKTGSTGYLFEDSTYSVQFANLDIDGGNNTDQSGTVTAGNRSGIHVSALLPNNSITNVSVHGFSNIGIGLNGTGSLAGYPGPPTISGVNVYYNYVGIDTGVGGDTGSHNTGEYLKISGVTAYKNRIGIIINSGNNSITGSHFDTNGYGVKITDAYNNAHGTITGSTINHNTLYGFYINGATNGFSIVGNQNFYSNVYINNSTGINIQGNTFGGSAFTLNTGGVNYLKGNWFTGNPSITRSSDNFVISDNFYGATPTFVSGYQDLVVNSNLTYNLSTSALNLTGSFTQTGNVGIGTTSPGAKLVVSGSGTYTASGASRINLYNSVWTKSFFQHVSDSGVWQIADSDGQSKILVSSGASGAINFYNGSGNVIFNGTGNVGIGTTAPLYKLAIGTPGTSFNVDSSGYALHPLGLVGTPSLTFTSDTNTGLWSSGADTLNFSTAGSEWMRIKSDGNVGIGTTNPGAQLDLSTDSARKLTSNTWSTGSDSRIKTNIESIENALEIIREVRPVKYHYTAEFLAQHPSVTDTDYYNFIAQEYQEIFPESVTEIDGLLFLNSSNMIPYAIAGIKEIDSRLTELELLLGALNANGTIGDGAISGTENNLSMVNIIKNALSSLGLTIENGILSIKELIADKITTKELCIDDVCINRSQLKELLDKNDSTEDVDGEVVTTADTISPIITLLGDSTVNLVVGDSYTDAGATASDDTDDDITAEIIIVNPVDANTAGTYTITYNISDAAGNKATEVTRTVIISVPESDTTSSTPTGEDTTDVQTPDASGESEG